MCGGVGRWEGVEGKMRGGGEGCVGGRRSVSQTTGRPPHLKRNCLFRFERSMVSMSMTCNCVKPSNPCRASTARVRTDMAVCVYVCVCVRVCVHACVYL